MSGICNHYKSKWAHVRVKCDMSVVFPTPPPPFSIPPPSPPSAPPPVLPPPSPPRRPPPAPHSPPQPLQPPPAPSSPQPLLPPPSPPTPPAPPTQLAATTDVKPPSEEGSAVTAAAANAAAPPAAAVSTAALRIDPRTGAPLSSEPATDSAGYAWKAGDLDASRSPIAKVRAFLAQPPPSFLRAVFLASVGCLLLSLAFLVRSSQRRTLHNGRDVSGEVCDDTMDDIRFMEDLDTTIDPSKRKVR